MAVSPPQAVHSKAIISTAARTSALSRARRAEALPATIIPASNIKASSQSICWWSPSKIPNPGGANLDPGLGGAAVRAVVLMVTVADPGCTPSRVTDVGEMAHVERTGFPEHVSETIPLNPFAATKFKV